MSAVAGKMVIVKDADALSQRAAEIIAERMKDTPYPFRLVLAGGSTPRPVYRLLANMGLDWFCCEIFFGDERLVPPDDPDSNYKMAHDTLLANPQVAPRKVFAIPTDGTADRCAQVYEETLKEQYGASHLAPDVPLFHVTLLGLGDDGHTASLLPGQPILQERTRWVAPVPEGREQPRVTLTYTALESSALILFLVSGANKRDALAQARGGALPAGALRPQGQIIWLVDAEAAGEEDQGYGF